MVVHVMAEGAVVSRGPVPMRPKLVLSSRGKSRGGSGMLTTIGVDEFTMGVLYHFDRRFMGCDM
jgi:hypothetical protein